MSRIDFTPGTKRFYIAQYAERGVSWDVCYYELKDKVREQTKPWIFTANPPRGTRGRRTPKAMHLQYQDLKNEIRRVYAALNRAADDIDVDTTDVDMPRPEPVPEPEPTPEPEPDKPIKKQSKSQSERHFFHSEWKRIRQWISQKSIATGASPVDSLESMRPLLEAKRGIAQNISAKALLFAMTLHWSKETRSDAGIEEISFFDESDHDLLDSTHHRLTGYVAKLAQARIPIMLVGPAGTGKSRLLRKMAEEILDLPYGEVPMTAGATPSWLLGKETLKSGYQISEFLKIYTEGGVFNFEEIDAADANMLIVVNNALALNPGDPFFNPVNGQSYVRHEDFIPAATANTWGIGANALYTGRERLDFATIDRFRMGRVFLELDEDLAARLILED